MNELICVFSFTVAPENQERYEEIRKQQFEISKNEEGTLLYEVFRDKNGVYCQHERYANEEACMIHVKNTYELLQEWMQLTEMQQTITLGKVSNTFIEQFQLKEIYAPYAHVEK